MAETAPGGWRMTSYVIVAAAIAAVAGLVWILRTESVQPSEPQSEAAAPSTQPVAATAGTQGQWQQLPPAERSAPAPMPQQVPANSNQEPVKSGLEPGVLPERPSADQGDFQRRFEIFRRERQVILNAGLSPTDQQEQVENLLRTHFSQEEIERVRSYPVE